MEFLKFLNENSGAIGVIFSGLVTIESVPQILVAK